MPATKPPAKAHAWKTWPGLVVQPDASSPAARSLGKRRLRQHHVLNVIRQHGPMSRGDIVNLSGFNLPSVSSFVDELIRDGLVTEEKVKTGRLGRHPVLVALNPHAACVLGVDLGKRSTTVLVLNLAGQILARAEQTTPAVESSAEFEARAVDLVLDLAARQGPSLPPLAGVGIALPGLIEWKGGGDGEAIAETGRNIRRALRDRLAVPVFVDNDARVTALASLWFGPGREYDTFAVMNVGHGLGLGIVVDHKLFRGAMGFSGELGQTPMGDAPVPWYTGADRALENVASGAGIARLAAEAGLGELDAEQVFALAASGNRKARKILERFAQHLARGAATVIALLNPEALVLTGRVCRSAAQFMPAFEAELDRVLLPALRERTPIHVGEHKESEASRGGAALVLHHIFTSSHVNLSEIL